MDMCHQSGLYSVQIGKEINLYDRTLLKISKAEATANQFKTVRRLPVKATLRCNQQTFLYSKFHNVDQGLLYASTSDGYLNLYDLHLLKGSSLDTPAV